VPNVEKHFLWKASHEILPTCSNLFRRKIIDDPMCPICGLGVPHFMAMLISHGCLE
jgi:hypothetical protein